MESKKLELWIDNRERDFIELFTQFIETNNEIDYEIKTLDIGDICIVNKETKDIYIVFERKTYSDLSASMKDGRYKEQKQRLLHALPPHVRKLYILEGNDIHDFGLDESIMKGFYINNMIRDRIFVEKTLHLQQTLEFILSCKNQFERKYDDFVSSILQTNTEQTNEYQMFHSIKKKNLNEKIIFKSMLSIIPNVSNSISEALFQEFSSMSQMILFLNQYEQNYSQMIEYISNIKHGNSNKRIGPSVSQKIITSLFLCNEEEKNQMLQSTNKKTSRKKNKFIETQVQEQIEERIEFEKEQLRLNSQLANVKKIYTKKKYPVEYLFSE